MTSLDADKEQGYTASRARNRLTLGKPKDVRCLECGYLLFREIKKSFDGYRTIEIKCRRCGRRQVCT